MSFARKLKRKGLNKTSCCGKQMYQKEEWSDDDLYEIYVCDRCGKIKKVTKARHSNDSRTDFDRDIQK